MEESKLLTRTKFSNTIDAGRIIAIYSSETLNEPFLLCNFLEKNTQISTFLMAMISYFCKQLLHRHSI